MKQNKQIDSIIKSIIDILSKEKSPISFEQLVQKHQAKHNDEKDKVYKSLRLLVQSERISTNRSLKIKPLKEKAA